MTWATATAPNRPDLKCRGPCRASHVARRAASSRTSSFKADCSSLIVITKSQATVVAIPMMPLVHEVLVTLQEQRDASVKSAPYVGLRDRMSTGGNAEGHAMDRVVFL